MSSPAAAPPHLPQKPGPGRSLEGLPEIIAFIIVAAVLVVGPKIWTVGEALASLGRSITGSRPAEVTAPVPRATATYVVRVSAPTAPTEAPPLLRAEGRPATPGVGVRAAPAQPKPAQSPRRSMAATTARPSLPVSAPPAPSGTNAARLRHYYALMDQGIRLYRAGWYGPSVARFRDAVAAMPTSPYAFLWLGRANLAAGNPSAARAALQQVIILAPDSQAAREASALLKQLAASNI